MKNHKNTVIVKLRSLLLVACAGLFVSGCETPTQMESREQSELGKRQVFLDTFSEAEYAPFSKPGTGSVSGQAFAVTRGGSVRYAAGRTVLLMPRTRHTISYVSAMRENIVDLLYADIVLRLRRNIPQLHPHADAFTKTAIADAEGRFVFDGVSEGSYIAATLISWDTGRQQTGDYFAGTVEVKDGKKVTVHLKGE